MTDAPDLSAPDLSAPDLSAIARDWITLVQSEFSALAVDREAQETTQALLALWAGMAAALIKALPRATPDAATGRTGAAATPGAPPAAPAPDAGGTEIEHLARRLAALETRLAELERPKGERPEGERPEGERPQGERAKGGDRGGVGGRKRAGGVPRRRGRGDAASG